MVVIRCYAKNFPKNLIYREIPVLEFLSNTVKDLQAVRVATLLKRDPRTGVSEPAVHTYS